MLLIQISSESTNYGFRFISYIKSVCISIFHFIHFQTFLEAFADSVEDDLINDSVDDDYLDIPGICISPKYVMIATKPSNEF
jgi:hypothetical protein